MTVCKCDDVFVYTALEDGNHSLADEIHVALMVDHVSEVSRWMVGIKRLIAILKQQSTN